MILVLHACSAPPPVDSGSDTRVQIEVTEPTPPWTADEVGARVVEFTEGGPPSLHGAADTFLQLMTMGDASCPGSPNDLNQLLGCTASTGAEYRGIGWFFSGEGGDFMPLDTSAAIYSHGGDFEIVTPEGAVATGGGGGYYSSGRDDTSFWYEMEMKGSWSYSAHQGWLGRGFSGVYVATGEMVDGATTLSLNGGMNVGGIALSFDDYGLGGDPACDFHPVGALEVRDPDGYWYRWELGDDCDDCGPLVYHLDQDLGELCLDLSEFTGQMFGAMAPG